MAQIDRKAVRTITRVLDLVDELFQHLSREDRILTNGVRKQIQHAKWQLNDILELQQCRHGNYEGYCAICKGDEPEISWADKK